MSSRLWLFRPGRTPLLTSRSRYLGAAVVPSVPGKEQQAVQASVATVTLAIVFTVLQVMEYLQAPLTVPDGIHGSTFYSATGFHGLHVLIGTIFLIIRGIRQYQGHLTQEHHVGLEAAAWYWHSADVVRSFPFVPIYWWGGH